MNRADYRYDAVGREGRIVVPREQPILDDETWIEQQREAVSDETAPPFTELGFATFTTASTNSRAEILDDLIRSVSVGRTDRDRAFPIVSVGWIGPATFAGHGTSKGRWMLGVRFDKVKAPLVRGGALAKERRTGDSSSGVERRRRAQGPKSEGLQRAVAALDPQIAEWVDEFVFGQVWGRPGLSEEERTLVAVTALAAGEHPAQLRAYLFGALHGGISARKIHEALVMQVVYSGFPVALQSLTVWHEVVESARRQGVVVDL